MMIIRRFMISSQPVSRLQLPAGFHYSETNLSWSLRPDRQCSPLAISREAAAAAPVRAGSIA